MQSCQTKRFGLVSVGDKMWSIQLDSCEVDSFVPYSNGNLTEFSEVRIRCVNKHGMSLKYRIDGKLEAKDTNMSLFKREPKENIGDDVFPKIMFVWDNHYSLKKVKLVYGKFGNRYLATDVPDDFVDVDKILEPITMIWWNNVEELSTLKVKTISKNDLAKHFGVDVVSVID